MEEYRSNSYKSREKQSETLPEKKVGKIISGSAKTKKKSNFQKITSAFVPEDVTDLKTYIFEEHVVPAVKELILDTVKTVLGMSGTSKDKRLTPSRTLYRKYYDPRDTKRSSETRKQTKYDYDDIVLENRGEAEAVIDQMEELIDVYNYVSLADFYDLVGVSCNFTDNKYGWTDIRSASIKRVHDGYMICFPPVELLK